MRYEAFGQSPVDHGVMNPTGEKMTFKTMSVSMMMMMEAMIVIMISVAKRFLTVIIIIRFGLWTWEWITAEEAERLANDGDPILEPVCPIIITIIIILTPRIRD